MTDQNACVMARHDYLPFGEEIPASTAGRNGPWGPVVDNLEQKFTGQMRDAETGLDYFGARYYGSALGRFTSPDPGNVGADIMNPQSWNAYAYVGNNPLANVDPTGMSFCKPSPGSIVCVQNDPDFATSTDPYQVNNALYTQWLNSDQFLNTGSSCSNCGGNQGHNNGNANQPPPKSGPATNPGNCVAGYTAAGAGVGAAAGYWAGGGAGALGGGAGGTAIEPIGGTAAGAVLGWQGGSALGAAGGFALGARAGYLLGNIVCSSGTSGVGGGGPQDKKLSPSEEVRTLEAETGESAHQIKTEALGTNKNIAQYDLYKNLQGNVFVKGKGGIGEAIPTGLRIP